MRNAALKDPVFKVGESSRFPTDRAGELSAETGAFGSFELVSYLHAGDRKAAGGWDHHLLADYWVSRSKEFFQAPLTKILKALDEAAVRFPVMGGTKREPQALPQPFLTVKAACQGCGTVRKVRELLVPVRRKCRQCGQELRCSNLSIHRPPVQYAGCPEVLEDVPEGIASARCFPGARGQ